MSELGWLALCASAAVPVMMDRKRGSAPSAPTPPHPPAAYYSCNTLNIALGGEAQVKSDRGRWVINISTDLSCERDGEK